MIRSFRLYITAAIVQPTGAATPFNVNLTSCIYAQSATFPPCHTIGLKIGCQQFDKIVTTAVLDLASLMWFF